MTDSSACIHCGDAGDHVHLPDSIEHARLRRRQLARFVTIRSVLTVAVVTALVVAFPLSVAVSGLLAGLVVWVIGTAAGVAASSVLITRYGRSGAVMYGALLAAALTPVLAALAALAQPVPGSLPAYAIAAGGGYLAGACTAEAVRLWRLRALLARDTRAGEVAREAAAATHHIDQDGADLLATAAMGIAVGGYVWLTGVLPLLVLVLVPWHVAIVALRRRHAVHRGRRQPVTADQPAS